MICAILSCVLIALASILWVFQKNKNEQGFKQIPGPKGLPLIGCVHQLGKLPFKQFNKWSQEFGDIYNVKLAGKLNIVISNSKMAKELFSCEVFSGRPIFNGLNLYGDEKQQLGLLNAEGELWEVHRRFLLRQLRDFGFGKASMENLIMEEVTEVISMLKKKSRIPISDTKIMLELAVIKSISALVDKTGQHDESKLIALLDNSHRVFSYIFDTGGILLFMPWLRYIIPNLSGYLGLREMFDELRFWFENVVKEHKRTFDENNMRDFIDVFLLEVRKTTDSTSMFYGKEAERQLVASLADLFLAGSDTTSTTLSWGIMYLCKYPKIQRKFQDEIASVTNNSRSVSVADRPSMPYTLAIIDEVLRVSSVATTGVPHRSLSGREFYGYFIPKDALLLPNIHFMHHDPKIWGDPENFRPERFLSEDEKLHRKSEYLIPFQCGRRQCVGETMARDTVFLYLTNIFQRFAISFDPSVPEPSEKSLPNFLHMPVPFSIILKDRCSSMTIQNKF